MKTLLTAALFFRMATHFNRGSGLSTIFIFCTAVYTHIWVQSMLSPQGEDTNPASGGSKASVLQVPAL